MLKKKVLVVDDEWAILELLRVKLSKRGFDVTIARDGNEFKKRAFEVNPDLLILDIWLGNQGGGPQIYDEVIRMGFNPKIPVIFISALVEEGQPPKHAPEGGRFALYGKPFDFELLLGDVKRLTGVENGKTKRKNNDESNGEHESQGGRHEDTFEDSDGALYGNDYR